MRSTTLMSYYDLKINPGPYKKALSCSSQEPRQQSATNAESEVALNVSPEIIKQVFSDLAEKKKKKKKEEKVSVKKVNVCFPITKKLLNISLPSPAAITPVTSKSCSVLRNNTLMEHSGLATYKENTELCNIMWPDDSLPTLQLNCSDDLKKKRRKRKDDSINKKEKKKATQLSTNTELLSKEPLRFNPVVYTQEIKDSGSLHVNLIICSLCHIRIDSSYVTSKCQRYHLNEFHPRCWEKVVVENSSLCLTDMITDQHYCTSFFNELEEKQLTIPDTLDIWYSDSTISSSSIENEQVPEEEIEEKEVVIVEEKVAEFKQWAPSWRDNDVSEYETPTFSAHKKSKRERKKKVYIEVKRAEYYVPQQEKAAPIQQKPVPPINYLETVVGSLDEAKVRETQELEADLRKIEELEADNSWNVIFQEPMVLSHVLLPPLKPLPLPVRKTTSVLRAQAKEFIPRKQLQRVITVNYLACMSCNFCPISTINRPCGHSTVCVSCATWNRICQRCYGAIFSYVIM